MMAISPTGLAYSLAYDNNLVSLDLESGIVSTIGDTGLCNIFVLPFNPTTGTLWALNAGGELYSISVVDGTASPNTQLGLDPDAAAHSIQIDSAGIMWILDFVNLPGNFRSELWTVDLNSSNIADSARFSGIIKIGEDNFLTLSLLIAPTQAATSTFTIIATNSNSSVDQTFTLEVVELPVVSG